MYLLIRQVSTKSDIGFVPFALKGDRKTLHQEHASFHRSLIQTELIQTLCNPILLGVASDFDGSCTYSTQYYLLIKCASSQTTPYILKKYLNNV